MKKIFYFTVLLSFSLSSCQKDFLERPPQNVISETLFWKTENDVYLAVNAIYAGIPGEGLMYDDGATDIVFAQYSWESPATVISSGIVPSSTNNTGWNFVEIRKANYFLANVDKVTMNEELKNRFKAEVRFMRAMHYVYLVNRFGDVPLITKELSIEESNVPRDPKSKVIQFVVQELTDVANILPVTYEGGKYKEKGRITKGAAFTLLARFQLQQSDFEGAAENARKVMALGYELFSVTTESNLDQVDDYSNLVNFSNASEKERFRLGLRSYEGIFHQVNEGNNEVILDRQYIEVSQPNFINTLLLDGRLGGYGSLSPTQNLVNLYQSFKAGETIIVPNNVTRADNYKNNLPAFLEEFKNRDPRFYATILFETAPWNALTADGGYVFNWVVQGNDLSKTGYNFRKLVDPKANRDNMESHSNFILMRYAEVLLMFAEAENEVNGPSDEIYAALDKIRERSGMPKVNQVKYNTKSSLREFIRNERSVELALEGFRYMDIRRWGIASDVMNTIYDLNNNIAQNRVWEDKLMLMPIPQKEIDNSHNVLKQNTGY